MVTERHKPNKPMEQQNPGNIKMCPQNPTGGKFSSPFPKRVCCFFVVFFLPISLVSPGLGHSRLGPKSPPQFPAGKSPGGIQPHPRGGGIHDGKGLPPPPAPGADSAPAWSLISGVISRPDGADRCPGSSPAPGELPGLAPARIFPLERCLSQMDAATSPDLRAAPPRCHPPASPR